MGIMKLSVVALDRMLYEGNVKQITVETTAGQITILPNHIAMAAVLEDAPLIVIDEDDSKQYIAVHKGYLSIIKNELLVVADDAIFAHEIDEARVREDIRRNEEIIKQGSAVEFDLDRARVRLQRDLTNIRVHDMYSK